MSDIFNPADLSVLDEDLAPAVEQLIRKTQQLYLTDELPWVVGYSGGKDSTATLQLIWYALLGIPAEKRQKPIYVISTDTLVENPIVALWVDHSLKRMEVVAQAEGLPVMPYRLTPEVKDRFWVNLLGKGYPAPRPKFRWCTSRLKISASNKFIQDVVGQYGEAILALGVRKPESTARAKVLAKYEQGSTREHLSRNKDLDRVWVYSPIVDWSNDDVWEFICSVANPWGHDNRELLTMYRGATEGGECPLVVDTSTPSCGDSRFGCYVCTLVDKDKSMQAMIQNDDEKAWMKPLVEFRNTWLTTDDRPFRDYRRMDGTMMVHGDRIVKGPYTQAHRANMLRALLQAQQVVRSDAPEHVVDMVLISLEELEEIRRIWVVDKHEIEDVLPSIYEEVIGEPYPGAALDNHRGLSVEDLQLLRQICQEAGDEDDIKYEMLRNMLDIEVQQRHKMKRSGIFEQLDKMLKRSSFASAAEAESIVLEHASLKQKIDINLRDVSVAEGSAQYELPVE